MFSRQYIFLIYIIFFIDRCLDGTYDVFGEGQLPPRPMPGLHYPPYFTLSSYIYRMGPVRRDEALPHGFMPAAQCGQVQLLKCVKDQ